MLQVGFQPQWRHTAPVRCHLAKLQGMPGLNSHNDSVRVGPFYTGGSRQLCAAESGFQTVLQSKFKTSHSDQKKRKRKKGQSQVCWYMPTYGPIYSANRGRKVFWTQEFKTTMANSETFFQNKQAFLNKGLSCWRVAHNLNSDKVAFLLTVPLLSAHYRQSK